MMTSSAPAVPALSDAIALIKLVQDPERLAERLAHLHEATVTQHATLQALRDAQAEGMKTIERRKQELDSREREIVLLHNDLRAAHEALAEKQTAQDAHEAALISRTNALVARERILNEMREQTVADRQAAAEALKSVQEVLST